MKSFATTVGAIALLLSPLSAQALSRGEQQLTDPANTLGSPVNLAGFGHWRIASPTGDLPADAAAGLGATAAVVYATYTDENATSGAIELVFRRSTDGGITWDAPQTIYTPNTAAGESLRTGGVDTTILADGHNVIVLFLSNAHDPNVSGQSGWAMASNDQGQTFGAPLLLSPQSVPGTPDQFNDLDEIRAVLDGITLHVIFEADYIVNPSGNGTAGSGSEDLFYTQATIDPATGTLAITVQQTRIDAAHAAGSVDIDCPAIATDMGIVTIVWNDDRTLVPDVSGALVNQNDTYSRTSLANGVDFGNPASTPETNHTNFTTLLSDSWAAPRCPNVAVQAPNVVVFMEDSRDGQSDAIYADVSLSAGVVYSPTGVRVSANPPGEDVDGVILAQQGDLFALFTKIDRVTRGLNDTNTGFVYTGTMQDVMAGTMTEAAVSPAQNLVLYGLEIEGDVVACVYESCAFPEEAYVAISSDRGANFAFQKITSGGSCSGPAGNADVDDVRVAITSNRDVNVIWADDRNGPGNVREDVFVTSTKVPTLVDNTNTSGAGLGGSMELVGLCPSDIGDWAFLMISGTGTAQNNALMPSRTNGFLPNLTRDLWFDGLLGDVSPVLEVVGTDPVSGQARAVFDGNGPAGIPNLRVLVGLNFWVAAGTAQISPLQFNYFSDTLQF